MFMLMAAATVAGISQVADKKHVTPRELKSPEIIIRKKDRVLELHDRGAVVRSFTMVLGFAPVGDKEVEGDGKTPEGEFYVFTKNPRSKFHLSLGISYPSKDDAQRGLASGKITRAEHDQIVSAIDRKRMPPQKTALGGEIYIHGGGIGRDWTWGCIALENADVEELFNVIPVGTKVTILP
jgi:murein L,D-transpeptidase YafK